MREIIITANDAGRRLDRFLRKYLRQAALGDIYKIIRKDVKVCGKRQSESYILKDGDILSLYLSDEALQALSGKDASYTSRGIEDPHAGTYGGLGGKSPNFKIVYEDEQILIADKPYGLLTHGDAHEKKDHLANRVKDYLIASGAYNPRIEKVFTPAPVNRLDRNTTGLVLFGKTSEAMRELARMIRDDEIHKYYLTLACGIIEDELHLSGSLVKDESANKVNVVSHAINDGSAVDASLAAGGGAKQIKMKGGIQQIKTKSGIKSIETIVKPFTYSEFGQGYRVSLCEVELVTGRTHQIRAHLASTGHPLVGDSKYGTKEFAALNRFCKNEAGLSTQFLHAYKVDFIKATGDSPLSYLNGKSFESPLPARLCEVMHILGISTDMQKA